MELRARMSNCEISQGVIEACQSGDREAFRQLFEAYKDRVYSIALYFFGGNEAQAQDVTQQVFLKLFTRVEQFRHDAEFATWLYRVVINTCMDERRKHRRFIFFGDNPEMDWVAEGRSQESACYRLEVESAVQEAIASLKPKFRLPILLKYIEGLSYEQMAEVLACSPGTIASRLNRGHKMLAQKLSHLRGALMEGDR